MGLSSVRTCKVHRTARSHHLLMALSVWTIELLVDTDDWPELTASLSV